MSNLPDDSLSDQQLQLLAEADTPVQLDDRVKQRIKAKIQNRISDQCPDGGKTIESNRDDWFDLNDKISIKILHQDFEKKIQTSLWRLKPGATIPSHRHSNDEECLVVEGSLTIGQHKLNTGDFHFMEKESYHPELFSEHGALLYLRHDMHEHLMGPA